MPTYILRIYAMLYLHVMLDWIYVFCTYNDVIPIYDFTNVCHAIFACYIRLHTCVNDW